MATVKSGVIGATSGAVKLPPTTATTTTTIDKIKEYDSSDAVNQFYIDEVVKTWFNVSQRNSLTHSVTTWKEAGNSKYTLDLRDHNLILDIDCDKLLDMLSQLENYAVQTYNVTSQHIVNVNSLTSIKDVVDYDYTKGYPKILYF